MKVSDPNSLLEHAEGLLLFNLLEQASYICTEEVENALLPPPAGLYINGHIKPLLNNRDEYYPRSQFGNPDARIIDFKSVFQLQEDIVDDSGDIILSSFNIINRPHIFTTEPILPITAINVCQSVILDYLFKYCKYARGFRPSNIANFIKPEARDLMDEEYFEDSLSDALDQLHEFIKQRDWNIYFTKLNGTTLMIEQMIDWRIYQWTETEYKKRQEELGEWP